LRCKRRRWFAGIESPIGSVAHTGYGAIDEGPDLARGHTRSMGQYADLSSDNGESPALLATMG
jgi:hypothetical protein